MRSETSTLRALGENTPYPTEYDPSLLEAIPMTTEYPGCKVVHLDCPEFTSRCPKTGQPDFAHIKIWYVPRNQLVESKSLKLYLGSFRNSGEFHESCVEEMADQLYRLLDPYELVVVGEFTPRGGISIWPVVFRGQLHHLSALITPGG